MKTWTLTEKTLEDNGNDVSLTYGTISMATDLEALRIRIDAALQIIKGEMQDSNEGVDYFGVVFGDSPMFMKVQEISNTISNIEGVKEVLFDSSDYDSKTSTLSFRFTINSVYGDFEYEKTFENIA